jgi:hypothetical protein
MTQKRPWLKLTIAGAFGLAVALGCIAETLAFRVILPW